MPFQNNNDLHKVNMKKNKQTSTKRKKMMHVNYVPYIGQLIQSWVSTTYALTILQYTVKCTILHTSGKKLRLHSMLH